MNEGDIAKIGAYDIYKGLFSVYALILAFIPIAEILGVDISVYFYYSLGTIFTIILLALARGVPSELASNDRIIRNAAFAAIYLAPMGILALLGLILVQNDILFLGFGFLLVAFTVVLTAPAKSDYNPIRPYVLLEVTNIFVFMMFFLLLVEPTILEVARVYQWLRVESLRGLTGGLLLIICTFISEKISDRAFYKYYASLQK